MDHLTDAQQTTIVRSIENCLPNLKDGLEEALRLDAAVFFLSIVLGDEAHAIPVMAPVNIANRLASELFKMDRLDNEGMGELLKGIVLAQRMNSIVAAPLEMHIRFVGLYERLIWSAMEEAEEAVKGLAELTPGDLVVMQVILHPEETAVSTGMRVVKNPLQVFEREGVAPAAAKDDPDWFSQYVFPSGTTRH